MLATVSDRKVQVGSGNMLNYYTADVVSAQDYYPFGMLQPGRTFNAGGYRYGFNGKENDNEVKGEGNQQDYGMRIYDPRIAKFLSVDPLTRTYPWYSPYQFAGDNPIKYVDVDGLEPGKIEINDGQIVLAGTISTTADIYKITYLNVILGLKLPTGISDNPYQDEDPNNISNYERAFANVKFFFTHHSPAFSYSKSATKKVQETVISALFSGDLEKEKQAVEQIDKSEGFFYRHSVAEIAAPIVTELAVGFTNYLKGFMSAARTFVGDDPLTTVVANLIEKDTRNSIVGVERKIVNSEGVILTDFDIEHQKYIIEVTRGSGKGKLTQISERITPNTSKPVVLFAPKMPTASARQFEKNGVKVFRKIEELIKYVNKK